ncbi:MAG: ABC transporter ATP-binding protein [bacterium]|nr:ABC transporter ATP-binding protein [bacterium]
MFSFNISRIVEAYKLVRRMFGRYKKQITILAVLGFVSGLLEAIGVNALIPLFSFFVEGDSRLGGDFLAKYIRDFFAFFHLPFTLPALLIFISALFLMKAALSLYFNYVRSSIRLEYERATMSELYKETLYADWPYLSRQKIGHLETVIMTNVRMSSRLLESIARHVGVITELSMYLVVALTISKTVTIMTLGLGAFIFLIFKPLLYKVRSMSKKTEELNREVSRHVNESIGGMKVIKALGSEDSFIKISNSNFNIYRHLQMRTAVINNFMITFIQPISVVFMCVVVAFAYYRTSYNLGALAAIVYLIQKMFAHIQSLQSFIQIVNNDIPYVQGILEYKDKASKFNEIQEKSGGRSFSFKDRLSFENISFTYETGSTVLDNISFEIKRGTTVGFIGKSGSGKTTIFDLVLRLLKPTSGVIKIDGADVQGINIPSWRNRIAYVPQDAFLLNDTIYNNIVFYNENVSKEDVERAAKLAHLDEFVSEMKDGYDTVVGERGVRLSGGQRQRIAIARALARRPEILLLDEATSALDVESEAYVQEAIKELKGKITILIIAHRLGTVANSDLLMVIDKGRIIESGKPADLLKDKETYYGRVYNIRN